MSYTYNGNYSGRPIVYPNEVPFDTDLLRESQYRMVDVAMLAQTILGLPQTVGGVFNGFASGICTQNATPNMTVQIGNCSVYQNEQMEPIPYGNLGPITNINLFKQGINLISFNSSTLPGGTFTAPATPGQSQYYLIQGQIQTLQINNVNRPYYNASSPQTPNFNSNFDTEIDQIAFNIVAGTPSTNPVIPPVTAGYVGMFLILVANGQTSILNSDISYYPGSFIGETLPFKTGIVDIQNQTYTYLTDIGTANNYVATPSPALTAYKAGQSFEILIANSNTTASTVNLNGLGAVSIILPNGSVLSGGNLLAGMIAQFTYNGTSFMLMNAQNASVPAGTIIDFAGSTAPVGYLNCDGSLHNISDYPALYAAIGLTWNASPPVGQFQIPKMERTVKMGSGGGGTIVIGDTVGSVGGEEAHTMSLNELFPHTHNTFSQSSGTFAETGPYATGRNSPNDAGTSSTTGGGQPFNIIQPSAVVLMCIKT